MKWPPVWMGTSPRMAMPSSSQRNSSDRTADAEPQVRNTWVKKRTRGDDNDDQYFRNTYNPLESTQGSFKHAQHDKSDEGASADKSRRTVSSCKPMLH